MHAARLERDAVWSGFSPRDGRGVFPRGREASYEALPAVCGRAGEGSKYNGVFISMRMHRWHAGVHIHKETALFFTEGLKAGGEQRRGLGVPKMRVGFHHGGPHTDDITIKILLCERLGEGLAIDLAPARQIDEADLVEGVADLRHLLVKHVERLLFSPYACGKSCPGVAEIRRARVAGAPHEICHHAAPHAGADGFEHRAVFIPRRDFVVGLDTAVGEQFLDIALELEIPRRSGRINKRPDRALERLHKGRPQRRILVHAASCDLHLVEARRRLLRWRLGKPCGGHQNPSHERQADRRQKSAPCVFLRHTGPPSCGRL